ncbi:hypothetical protein G5714_024180 [Onychostoma macrolepis]|uniref:Uncharacterized protein n=1 Tax=Onychostoma macrolepis TaxID=369639 RepID=A0A7J6BN93_9TELE|nr:hypothetical protein G5714_024180 [Onychostoma macrolepis]
MLFKKCDLMSTAIFWSCQAGVERGLLQYLHSASVEALNHQNPKRATGPEHCPHSIHRVAAQVSNPNSHHSPQYDAGPGFEQTCFDSLPIWPAQQGGSPLSVVSVSWITKDGAGQVFCEGKFTRSSSFTLTADEEVVARDPPQRVRTGMDFVREMERKD